MANPRPPRKARPASRQIVDVVAVLSLLVFGVLPSVGAQDADPDEQDPDPDTNDPDSGTEVPDPNEVTVPEVGRLPFATDVRVQLAGVTAYAIGERAQFKFYLENGRTTDINALNQNYKMGVFSLTGIRVADATAALQSIVAEIEAGRVDPFDPSTFDEYKLVPVYSEAMMADRAIDWWVPGGATCELEIGERGWDFRDANGNPVAAGDYLYTVQMAGLLPDEVVVGAKVIHYSQATGGNTDGVHDLATSEACGISSSPPFSALSFSATTPGFRFRDEDAPGNRLAAGAVPFHWCYNNANVPVNPDMTAAAARQDIADAGNTWEGQHSGWRNWLDGDCNVVHGNNIAHARNGISTVTWSTAAEPMNAAGNRAETWCRPYAQTGFTECDILINSAYQQAARPDLSPPIPAANGWSAPNVVAGRMMLQDVMTHEFGHVVGLADFARGEAHCRDNYASPNYQTMCQGASVTDARTSITWGDVAGERYLYPLKYDAVRTTDTGTRTGVGSFTDGTDAAMGFVNAGSAYDLVVGWIDAPSGDNTIYYRWVLDLNSGSGAPGTYGAIQTAVSPSTTGARTGVGHYSDGLGLDIARIGGAFAPDLIFTWVDAVPNGENEIYYRIGWDLSATGIPTSWSPIRHASSTFAVGGETGDMDACIIDVDNNGVMDLVLGWMDGLDGDNMGRMVVGFGVSTSTGIPSSWGTVQSMSLDGRATWEGDATDGVGLECVRTSGVLDFIFAWVDAPSGENRIRYRVGETINAQGRATNWHLAPTSAHMGPGAFSESIGHATQGLGVAYGNFDNNNGADFVYVWTDDPSGANRIYYWIEWNIQYRNHEPPRPA